VHSRSHLPTAVPSPSFRSPSRALPSRPLPSLNGQVRFSIRGSECPGRRSDSSLYREDHYGGGRCAVIIRDVVQTGRVTRYSHRDHRDVCYFYRAIGIGIPRAALLKVSRLGRDFRRRLSKFCQCVFLRQKSVSVYAESFSMSRDAHYRRARHKSPAIPPSGASRS